MLTSNVEYLYELSNLGREVEFKIAAMSYIEKKVININQEKVGELNKTLCNIENALKINDVITIIDLIEHELEMI
ncbi:hypothetical protein FDB34_02545 [Clostridium botulinum]|nr:hypothetical protein [Clostridium botulinum]